MSEALKAGLISLAAGLFLAGLFAIGLKTGRAYSKFGYVDRRTAPRLFWLGQSVVAAVAVVALIRAVMLSLIPS